MVWTKFDEKWQAGHAECSVCGDRWSLLMAVYLELKTTCCLKSI
jgi:hypothetical protein